MARGKRLKPPKEEDNILKLPSQITIEILSTLPVKTIACCSCVCKAWRSLLSDPCARFPQIHLSKSPVSLMLYSSYRCWLIEFDKDFRNRKMSAFSDEHVISGFPFLRCSCNGLLCLEVNYALYVWNPVKNDCVTLPMPNIKPGYSVRDEFGFCPRTNVYKLIRMVEYSGEGSMASSDKAMCEVCTLGPNAHWRTIEDVPVPATGASYNRRVCEMPLNGAVHWFCSFVINNEKFPLWVCAFRVEDEKWDPILLPLPLLEGIDFGSLYLPFCHLEVGVLENCLAIFDRSSYSLLNIWMMKDYGVRESWTKCWSIGNRISSEIHVHVPSLQPLKLTNDGELLMFDQENTALVCFDPLKRLITRKQRIYGVRKPSKGSSMVYVASFISPTQVMKEEC